MTHDAPVGGSGPERKIIHLDMDAFYASVEQRDRPDLRGRPVIVGGAADGRGVVCAASYEARRYGVRSAMPSARAARRCPHAVFLRPDFDRYRAVSRQIHAILRRCTATIEPLSLDEAYLDVTDDALGCGSATAVAERLRHWIRSELQLIASAGVGPNKLVAKIASDADKPDGLCVVPPARVAAFLAPLPVRRIPGIGPKSAERLLHHGIDTVAALRRATPALLRTCLGTRAEEFQLLAWGHDDRPVRAHRIRKSLGIEDTFAVDLTTRAEVEEALARLVDRLCARAAAGGVRGRSVTLKIKYHDFHQITRSTSLSHATAEHERIHRLAASLLAEADLGDTPIRLLGVSLHHLDRSGAVQLELPWARS